MACRTGKLFAVGDHKQSIYRFRGAEVSLFTGPARVGRAGGPADAVGELPLAARRDSRSSTPCSHDGWRTTNRSRREHKSVGTTRNVEFLWTSVRGHGRRHPRRRGRCIARRIVELLADETPELLGDDGEPPRRIEAGDIALLFRSMTNVAIYEAALRRHGLDYYLVGGRAFFAQQEVYDLLNLLRAVENPQDSMSLVGALRSPFCSLSDEALFLLARHEDGVWAGLHDEENLARAPSRPAARRGHARSSCSLPGGHVEGPPARSPGSSIASSPIPATTRHSSSSSSATASSPTCGSSSTSPARSTAPACSACTSSPPGWAISSRASRARSRPRRCPRRPMW